MKAHRVAFILYRGIPKARECVLHKCDNRACVRPSHLFLGSVADNNNDMAQKGRAARKLNAQQVREIRLSQLSHEKTAKLFGISPGMVGFIKSGRYWKHVQ